jgi:hypothetical protein
MSIKNFLPKLKAHILPRIRALLSKDNDLLAGDTAVADAIESPTQNASDLDKVLFKDDRMYLHNILRINYTTYDVCRKQDTVNPATSHRDIMVLAENDDSDHPFLYARVIGIFHVNIIYTEGTPVDYRPRRLEFLWLRWFESDSSSPTGSWTSSKLDRLRFPPMAHEDAFGFLDPADVMRGCHIIPAFATKTRYADGKGLSRCAGDSGDWKSYYVNRYAHFSPAVFRPES